MKMHGLGNDFVVIDRRVDGRAMTADLARALGDRRRGLGFDQLAEITADQDTDGGLIFWNADGSLSSACGNATRCIAHFLMTEMGRDTVRLRTGRGILVAENRNGVTAVNMGHPILKWHEIPLSEKVDPDRLPIDGAPVATSMGNPHCTFFVDDVAEVDLPHFGARHEVHPLFPERTNVQVVQVIDSDRLRVRVWERGAGVTPASGSSSCAAAVAAARRGLAEKRVEVILDGGSLFVDWRSDGVWMSGPTAHVADGVIRAGWIGGIA